MAGALPPVVAELVATNSQFMAKMAESKAAMKDVAASGHSSFSKLGAVGGTILAGVAAGAVAVGGASVAMSIKFQNSMELIRTQAGASQAEVDRMSKAVLDMAGSVGTGPDTLAQGLYHVESAGLRGAKALDVLKVAAEGAKVGHANLEDVTNALDGAIVSGIKGVQNYSQAMGALNAIVGAGDMRMQDLADAMGTGIAATARTAGLSLTDVGAALAVFGDNNIRGTKAAIYLRQAITGVVAPSQKAQGALQSIGIGSTTLGEDLRKPNGLLLMLETLSQHLKQSGLDATQQAQVLAQAFGGARTSTGVEILLSQLDRLKTKYGDVTKGAQGFGADWQAEQKTAQYQLDQLGASMEAVGIKIGNALLPKLETLANDLKDTVNWFEQNKGWADLIGGSLATLAGIAATAWAVNKIRGWVNAVKDAVTWVQNLGKASVITAGEQDALGGKGGGIVPIGGRAAGAAGAGEGALAAGGEGAMIAEATTVASAAVPAVIAAVGVGTLAAGIIGMLNNSNYPKTAFTPGSEKTYEQTHGGSGGGGMGGLVAPSILSNTPIAAFGGGLSASASLAALTALQAGHPYQTPSAPTKGSLETGFARDVTLQQQISVLNGMKMQLLADSAKYGANSAQAHADAAALRSTADKWGGEHGVSLKSVNAQMALSYIALGQLHATQQKLETSGAGNLEQSKYIKGVLDQQLSHAKAVLAKDETTKASKQAIDQAKAKIADVETASKNVQGHIDQLKSVADQITKTKDTYDAQKQLADVMGKVNTDTSKLHSDLSTGIPVSKMPNSKVTGTISLKVS